MTVSIGPNLGYASFNGNNGSGSISVPGLQIGDFIIGSTLDSTFENSGNMLEMFVSVADEIQQLDPSNLSSHLMRIVFLRGV